MTHSFPTRRASDLATSIGDADTGKKLVGENVHVGKRFVKDRVARLRADTVAHLAPGDGGMVEIDGDTVGAYRDATGAVHAVSITCTHQIGSASCRARVCQYV